MRGQLVAALAGLALAVAGRAPAQEPDPTAAGSAQPLSLRYRFTEPYGVAEDPNRPGLLVQYQVGEYETIREETETGQGAPDRVERTLRTIYTERPAAMGRRGEVADAVRRYDSFRAGGAYQGDPRMPGLFRDMSVWYRPRAGTPPLLISLTPDRPIRVEEYNVVVHQPFLPRLMSVFPPPSRPVRVEDTWSVSRQEAHPLLGLLPEGGDFRLEGRLDRVDRAAAGNELTAIIDITGEMALEEGDGAVRAQISFVFEPTTAPTAAEPKEATTRPGAARGVGLVEARGYVSKVRMSRQLTAAQGGNPRLRRIVTRELVLQRRRTAGPAGAEAALPVPEKAPAPDDTNSWLLFNDPQRRFHVRFPQEMTISENDADALVLLRVRPDGRADTLILADVPREADAARDRKWTDPQAFVRDLRQNSARQGQDVIEGPMGWLPDEDWAPLKRRVYRYEAALKKNATRVYLDAYLVLFTRGDHFIIQAMTQHDDQLAYRADVEKMIRSLDLGPSASVAAGAAPSSTIPPAADRLEAGRPSTPGETP